MSSDYGFLDEIIDKHDLTNGRAKLTKTDITTNEDHVLIVPLGDIHYGHKDCDYVTLKNVLKWMYRTKNVYMIGMGDYIESSIIDSPGLFDQDSFLDDQLADMVNMLKPLAEEGRIIGLLDGNHERRVKNQTGLDITNLMCKMLNIKYLGFGMLHLIGVRTTGQRNYEKYTMYSTHGSSGAVYPQTKLLACMKLQQIADAECYNMGHVHSLAHQKIERYMVDESTGTVLKRPINYVLTGAYLKYWGTYAHMKSMPPSGDAGSPKIKLHTHEHRISVSL